MTADRDHWRLLRTCWPLFAGAWSGWLVVRRLLEMHWNGDSFGSAAYLMFGLCFAFIFFMVGAAIAVLLGRLVESLMRRSGAGVAVAVIVATLLNALAIWQIGNYVQSQVPALQARDVPQAQRTIAPAADAAADKGSYQDPCATPPPADSPERANWDAECR